MIPSAEVKKAKEIDDEVINFLAARYESFVLTVQRNGSCNSSALIHEEAILNYGQRICDRFLESSSKAIETLRIRIAKTESVRLSPKDKFEQESA